MHIALTSAPLIPHHARAGSLRQWLAHRLRRAARGLWRVLEAHGQRRAAAQLLDTAQRIQASQPDLAAELRRLARAPR